MSRGSTLTLYRVYKDFKVTDAQYERAMSEYERSSKTFCGTFDPKDIPLVMAVKPCDEYELDEAGVRRYVEPRDIEEYRAKHYCGFFLRDNRCWCDHLLEWNFTSGFDALIEHYSLSYCGYRNSEVRISKEEAGQMLAAIEYILGGVWDERLAMAMNNPFVHLLTDGYTSASYWKYKNRNRFDSNRRVLNFEQNGCKVTVSLPAKEQSSEQLDSTEDDESIEYWLRTFSSGLRAFLESDNWSSCDKEELMLVYRAWG